MLTHSRTDMAERVKRSSTSRITQQELRQRGIEATRNLRESMRLPTNPSDTDILGTALAEVAAEEGRRNPQFASEVRRRYEELLEQRRQPTKRGSRQTREELSPLMPIQRDASYQIDSFAPPDPQFLTQVYGRHQLNRALHEYTLDMLKQTADLIQAQHPGTKPTSRAKKDAVIAYIVQHSQE